MNVPPHDDGRALSRLLNHCTDVATTPESRPRGRDRLEAAVGGELARRLLGALAGDHRLPARAFVD